MPKYSDALTNQLNCPRIECPGKLKVRKKGAPLKKHMQGMNAVRRRMECDYCGASVFTLEMLEQEILNNYNFGDIFARGRI